LAKHPSLKISTKFDNLYKTCFNVVLNAFVHFQKLTEEHMSDMYLATEVEKLRQYQE